MFKNQNLLNVDFAPLILGHSGHILDLPNLANGGKNIFLSPIARFLFNTFWIFHTFIVITTITLL